MDPWADDRQLVELLDAYLERLHTGQVVDREGLLAAHPGLGPLLDCLDALDSIAAVAAPPPDHTATETTDRLPRDFGSYKLLREIGRGGMGVVYLAHQRGLERQVALKMILAANLASAEHVRRFQAEARAAAQLTHPHIVSIHEVGQLHGQYYFTMDYVAGQSLAQRLAQGPMAIDDAVRLMRDVARAVAHLHAQGIVHRDLKPSNILLDTEGRPYVTDFGLAKVFTPGSDATTTGVIAGTPSYMAPEQASAQRSLIGPASDVYGLGAILYELLTGAPPFRAATPLDTLLQVLGRDPLPPRRLNPRIPRALELLCLKCLDKSPAARYPSAAALADDLERFLEGEPLAIRPPHLGQRLWRWSRRRPALASHLGALGLFYAAELAHLGFGLVDRTFHLKVSLIAALWVAGSMVCQWFFERGRWALVADFAWGALDTALLLVVLLVGNGAASALVVGYPLLIVGSGLWFRVRFVWYMTGLSLLSYGALVVDYYTRRTDLHAVMQPQADRHVIFAVSLIVLGAMVSHLVERLRSLSRFYGRVLDR
jgi:predicted Ser/Thr protein kinase